MQLKDSIIHKKSKKFLSRTLHTLKQLVHFDGYRKLHQPSSSSRFRPFSCASCREQQRHGGGSLENANPFYTEESYPGLSGKWTGTEDFKQEIYYGDDEPGAGSIGISTEKAAKEEEDAAEKVKAGHPPLSSKGGGGEGRGFLLAKKMKELEMMEVVGDMEHVLDIEEALHYYSRLTSPIYAGIVDHFFTNMYSDFSLSSAAAPPPGPSLPGRGRVLKQRWKPAGRPSYDDSFGTSGRRLCAGVGRVTSFRN